MSWRKMLEPVLRPVFHIWWRFRRGMTLGVRIIARRDDGQVILVKHTYIHGWHLPGGGVDSGETISMAAARELAEEVGLKTTAPLRLLALQSNDAVFKGDHIALFEATSFEPCATDNAGEIEAFAWFDPGNLPEDVSPATARRLAEYVADRGYSQTW